jgi:OOP family OmpA-OmpF porin
VRRIIQLAFLAGLLGLSVPAYSQTANAGFQVNRYEPTAAGEWSFSVDHPWYSSMRYFAAGITLNYAHNPLVFGLRDTNGNFTFQNAVIAHQLIGHVDLAGSFLDRVMVLASLPITFLERGIDGQNGIRLVGGTDQPPLAVGDLRLGAKVRLFGQPYKGAISMSLGVDVWVPINSFTKTFPTSTGESGVRVLPKAMLGGLTHSVMWSFTAGFLYRPESSIGDLLPGSGNSVGPEIQLGAAIAYANTDLRLAVGPEAILSTVVTGGHGFKQDYTSLELLLGLHYNIAKLFQLGLAGGVGLLREPGTPDGRLLFRFAYAPMRDEKPKDRDHDGIIDKEDACPDDPGVRSTDLSKNGCPPPPPDSDMDGIIDPQDRCPTEHMGKNPDPEKKGCPLRDKDGDGVYDNEDQCVDEPMGTNPDAEKKGCPLRDKDGDGVFDPQDQCVEVAAGPNPDPSRAGCPDKDSDGDGVYDGKDQCKTVPSGMFPDTAKPGCPLPDRDRDFVPDPTDACPDQAGAPSTDPKKNGCPGIVEVKNGQIVILRQVFFATGKDVILKKSFPVLDAVVSVLKSTPQFK